MEVKRKKLLELIEELKLPILPEEAEENMAKLSDEEIDSLLAKYQKLEDYRDSLEEYVKEVDPEEYAKIEGEYQKELNQIDEEELQQLEKIQEEEDLKLDSMDAKSERQDKELEEKFNEELKDAEETYKDVNSAMNKVLSENPSEVSSNNQ